MAAAMTAAALRQPSKAASVKSASAADKDMVPMLISRRWP